MWNYSKFSDASRGLGDEDDEVCSSTLGYDTMIER